MKTKPKKKPAPRKRKIITNPNNANQWLADPRQELFWANYTDPKSKTFGNALQSAKKAGFSPAYANRITAEMPTWLAEKLRKMRHRKMVELAEKNLTDILTMKTMNTKITKLGQIVKFDDYNLRRIKSDISKFVAERLDKETYSQKIIEDTGDNKTVLVQIEAFTRKLAEDITKPKAIDPIKIAENIKSSSQNNETKEVGDNNRDPAGGSGA